MESDLLTKRFRSGCFRIMLLLLPTKPTFLIHGLKMICDMSVDLAKAVNVVLKA